ncbi:hypothetical protein AC629_22365 [Bradyrhizobium sp. NAS80.1]|uniref:tetratricopeptide repeat protein n=1 Tax=Bradyrhizobium sp. NAS80.1 TaxID=1680159 RepID=UPI00096789F0|nr:winged helix-turn-helix domain-containing protein [Bradyrhizobium sp. NAS80.1]OKO83735.1 hypothetical protein AC629_22365 [Bradyrhizobium sp. NAS80.1]
MKNSDGVLKSAPAAFVFGPFRLDCRRRVLERDGTALPIYPRAFDALVTLLANRDALMSKANLLDRLWPDSTVGENSLARIVSDLRKLLGDHGDAIVTVPRQGYRFDGAVRIEAPTEPSAEARTVIAVLPFQTMGTETDPLLALGLSDALIARLSQAKALVVRPTTAVAHYRDDAVPLADAGRALEADLVVAGHVRRQGERLRTTVQVLDVASGATVWAEQVDDNGADIFHLEDAIAQRVAAAPMLRHFVFPERIRTSDARAYELYLQARALISQRTIESLARAGTFLQESVDRDPRFALGHSALAETYMLRSLASMVRDSRPAIELMPLAKAAVGEALAIAPNLPEAITIGAFIGFCYDWTFRAAEQSIVYALQLAPGNSMAHHYYAIGLSAMRRHDEALEQIRTARELDPTSTVVNVNVGATLYWAGRFDEACAQLKSVVAINPDSAYARFRFGLALDAAGRFDEAVATFDALIAMPGANMHGTVGRGHALARAGLLRDARRDLDRLHVMAGECYVSSFYLAEIHCALGETDHALVLLEQALGERPVMMISLLNNPKFQPLADDLRFRRIVGEVGLV